MRHIRTRRRFKFVLLLIFGISALLFAEARIESLIPQLKCLAETKLEEAFDNKFDIAIGDVEGGLITPLVLNGCKIRPKDGSSFFESVNILCIKSNYRIWDVFFGEKKNQPVLNFFSRGSSIDINFTDQKNNVSGFLRFSGNLDASEIKGHLDISGKGRVGFVGSIHGDSFDIEFRTSYGNIKASGSIADDRTLTANLKTSHFKFYGFDINCEMLLRNSLLSGDASSGLSLGGEIETKSLVVNYKVFPDISIGYRIRDSVLEISKLSVGGGISMHGSVDVREPYPVNIILTLNNVNLSKMLSDFGISNSADFISGTLNGKCELKGPIEKSVLDAKLELRKGNISKLDYDYLTAHLRGEGPIIHIEESRITRPSGYFSIGGEIDLRKIGKPSIFENIKITTSESAILWDDLDTKTWQSTREISLTKHMSEQFSFGFKTFIQDNIIDESSRDTDEMAIEYKLHPNDSLKVMVGQDKNFFGLEHKDKF